MKNPISFFEEKEQSDQSASLSEARVERLEDRVQELLYKYEDEQDKVAEAENKIIALQQQTPTNYVDRKLVDLTHGNPKNDLSLSGYVQGSEGYRFEAKVFNAGSELGIDYGRISALTVLKDGHCVADYQRGWVKHPGSDHRGAVNSVQAAFPTWAEMTKEQREDDRYAQLVDHAREVESRPENEQEQTNDQEYSR